MFSLSATRPAWPHVACVSEDPAKSGFAWHAEKPACFTASVMGAGEIPLDAQVVGIAIDGRGQPQNGEASGIDVISGIEQILAVSFVFKNARRSFSKLFSRKCIHCGKNHFAMAHAAVHAERFVHPDAIDALRAARVPKRYLLYPWIRSPQDPEDVDLLPKGTQRKLKNLPFWQNDQELTRRAQLAFASRWTIRREQTHF